MGITIAGGGRVHFGGDVSGRDKIVSGGQCRNCRHWGLHSAWFEPRSGLKTGCDLLSQTIESIAIAMDGEYGQPITIWTEPNFGCNQWEAKS